MGNANLQNIWQDLQAALQPHWADCLEFGLDGHSAEAHAAVQQRLSDYFARLQSLPHPASHSTILECLRALFGGLDEVSARYGSGLLETDERELIVGPVCAAAETAGLNLDHFEGRDPTLEFRNF